MSEDAELKEFLRQHFLKMSDFEKRITEDCPNCGSHVSKLEQVGRCVYARPCDCRIWQGFVPDKWKD